MNIISFIDKEEKNTMNEEQIKDYVSNKISSLSNYVHDIEVVECECEDGCAYCLLIKVNKLTEGKCFVNMKLNFSESSIRYMISISKTATPSSKETCPIAEGEVKKSLYYLEKLLEEFHASIALTSEHSLKKEACVFSKRMLKSDFFVDDRLSSKSDCLTFEMVLESNEEVFGKKEKVKETSHPQWDYIIAEKALCKILPNGAVFFTMNGKIILLEGGDITYNNIHDVLEDIRLHLFSKNVVDENAHEKWGNIRLACQTESPKASMATYPLLQRAKELLRQQECSFHVSKDGNVFAYFNRGVVAHIKYSEPADISAAIPVDIDFFTPSPTGNVDLSNSKPVITVTSKESNFTAEGSEVIREFVHYSGLNSLHEDDLHSTYVHKDIINILVFVNDHGRIYNAFEHQIMFHDARTVKSLMKILLSMQGLSYELEPDDSYTVFSRDDDRGAGGFSVVETAQGIILKRQRRSPYPTEIEEVVNPSWNDIYHAATCILW